MAKKYWWEEDEKQTTDQSSNQSSNQSNTDTAKKYWWEEDDKQSTGGRYWWDDGTTAKTIANNVTNRVNTWLQNHNSYLSNYQNRYSGRKGNYEDAFVSDSASWLDTISKQHEEYRQEAKDILAYVDQYKDYLDAGWVNNIRKTLISGSQQQRNLVTGATKDNEWWSKFTPNEEQAAAGYTAEKLYNEWSVGQKQYADDLAYDVAAGELELEKLQQEREAYFKEQAEKQKEAQENESFWDSLGRWLGTTPDTTIPLGGVSESSGVKSSSPYDRQISEMEEQIKRAKYVQGYEGFMGNMDAADYGAGSQYVSTRTNVPMEDATYYVSYGVNGEGAPALSTMYDKSKLFGDFLYDYINRNEDALDVAMVNDTSDYSYFLGHDKGFLQTMKDEEIGVYNYLYNTKGPEAANAFLSFIESDLEGRRRLQEQARWAEYAKESPFGSSVFSTLISPLKGLSYISQAADMLDDGKMKQDAAYNRFTYIPTTIRNQVSTTIENSGKWGKVGSFAYNTGMSMADFLFTTAVSGGNQAMSLAIMGSGAAADATLAAKDRGLDDGEAFALGTIAGLAEVAMEKISLGAWLEGDMTEGALRYVLKNALSEGGEEASTSVINLLADVIIAGDKSEWNTAMQAYIDAGKSPEEAFGLVAAENAAQIGLDALGGMLSGSAIGGGTYAGSSVVAGSQYGNIAKDKAASKELVSEGIALNPTSQYIQKMQGKVEKGKNLTGMQVRNILAANQEQITNNDLKKIQQAAEKRLTNLGQTENVAQIAELATKRATGQELTRAEKSILANSQYGARVANELLPENIASENFSTEWAEEIGTRNVNAAAYNKKAIRTLIDAMANAEDPATYKSLAERAGTESSFNVSKSGQATIRESGEVIDLRKAEVAEFVKDKKGNVVDMVIKADGKEVKASQIDYADGDQSYLFEAVSKIENISPRAATAIVRDYDPSAGQTVGEYLSGVDEGFTYGYYGYSEADLRAGNFTPKLTDIQKKSAYELGRFVRESSDADADTPIVKMRTAAEAKMTAEQKERIESNDAEVYFQDGKSVVKFDAHTGKYDEKRMAAVNTAKFLSKLGIGGKYYFYESYVKDGARVYKDANGNEVEAPNGMYKESDGSIHIDLNAGDYGQGTALFTLGHELTHFIKAQSKKQFKVLGDLVTEAFDKTDMSMHERVLAKQKFLEEKRGEKVSYDEAYEEVVADAMSTMISDGSFFEMLMEIKVKDKGLFNTIKRFFEKLIAKFRKEYAELTPDQKDARDIREMKDMFDKIQKAFAESLVEASDNFQGTGTQKNTTEDGGVKMQTRTVNSKQVVWIENSKFTNKQLHDYSAIAEFIAEHIGEYYTIIESGQNVYIGEDLPNEYTHSKYTSFLQKKKTALLKAKNKASTALGEMIEIATNRRWEPTEHKASKDAKYGMYRYDTKFAFPIKDQNGNVTNVKAYDAELLIRNASDGKKYLYDIVNIKEDTTNALDLRHKEARKGNYKAATQGDVITNNIAQSTPNVNSQNSGTKSERGEGTSNRSLLANAFEGITQNSEEYKLIQEYRGRIKILNEYEEKLSKLNAQIREIRFTEGKHDAKKLRELEAKAKNVAEAINRNDRKLLSLEASEPLRKVIEHERKKEAQKTKDHVKEIQQNKKARAEQTELRHKIRKTVRDLDKLLNRGNKKANVKEDMKGFVSKALELADYLFTDHISNDDLIRKGITVRMTPREAALVKETEDILSQISDNYGSLTAEEYARLDAKRKSNMDKLRDLLTSQRNERLNTPVYDLFNDLVTEYATLKNSKQESVKAAYDPNVERFLREYMGEMNGETDSDRKSLLQNMRVADMTTKELQHLLYAYTMVMTSVRDANKLHIKGKTETIEQMAGRITGDFSKRKAPDGKVATVLRNLSNKIGWDYEKLYYALDRIGSEAFTELVMNIANSENIVMQDVLEAAAFRDEMVKNYGFNNWDVNKKIDREFLDNTGKKFKLTLGQMMALYAYSRREGAWDHIEYGGFVFGEAELTNPKPADSYKLSKAQCEAITNLLTKEQKGYVESMQKFLSETMGAKGNEVSMQLYGIKMFTEKNYFPIHIAGQFKAQANESQAKAAAGFSSMTNAGFTHAQNPNAKAPFVLEGFNDVWADHVNEMSRYHGTVPALEDMRRVMNRSFYSESGMESIAIKQMMENSFGKEAVDYFDNLYREANSGAITDKPQKWPKKLLRLFRKNSVAYSLSVLIQQPASLVRAYAMIDKKYFGYNRRGLFKTTAALSAGVAKAVSNKWTKAHTNAYNEMLKYAPGVTMAKEIGGFDTATGGSIRSYLLDTNKSVKQKWKTENLAGKAGAVMDLVDNNAIANLPNVADKIAWIEIWNACKRETVAKHKDLATSSEEFMQIVGERFTEVIRATQVYDSIFGKSPMLKSKNLAVQYLVSFMNEPNTTANMVEKAMRDVAKGDWKSGARTAAVVVHSIIFTNVLKSIVYAMRDDDEDETYIEKYLESITGNLIGDFVALNYIPLARDAWSIWQGYDVERPDMAVVQDAISAVQAIIKNINKDTENMTEEQLIEFDKKVTESNWKLVESIASLFGIPVKNIRREIEGVLDHARIASANAGMTTSKSAWDKVYDSVIDSIPFMQNKQTKTDKLYDAIISGDKTYKERIKSTYKDDSAYQSAVRKALKENDPRIHKAAQARYDGNTEEYKRIFREIQKEGKFTFDDIMSAVNSELSAIKNKLETDKATSQYSAGDFVEAIAMGNTSNADAIRDDIISAKVANGKTQEEAEKEFKSDVASDIGKAYSSGLLDEAEAEKMLVEYAGKDEDEAASKVGYWAFCEEHPQYKDVFTESNVNDYHEFAEPAKISLDVYAQFINGTKGLATIYDEWGDVEVSKREQVLEVIDSLPLTWQQKDALYLAAGYSESKIWDVPW